MDFIKENVLCDILVGLGLVIVIVSYVIMPLVARKTGHKSSPVPFVGGILIAAGFLTSPVKWLAVFCLVDISIPMFFIRFIPDIIIDRRDAYNRDIPVTIDGKLVVAYTSYYNRYYDHKIPLEDNPESFKVCPVERLAIVKSGSGYELLGLDYQFNEVTSEKYSSVEECKRHAVPKAQNRWINVNR